MPECLCSTSSFEPFLFVVIFTVGSYFLPQHWANLFTPLYYNRIHFNSLKNPLLTQLKTQFYCKPIPKKNKLLWIKMCGTGEQKCNVIYASRWAAL